MITNADITILNQRLDKETRREVYLLTAVYGVSLHRVKGHTGDSDREENRTCQIRIPVSAEVQGGRTYVPERAYARMSDEEVRNHWTLQPGCYILPEAVEPEEETAGALTLDQVKALLDGKDEFITLTEYADNTSRGDEEVRHWRIGGF